MVRIREVARPKEQAPGMVHVRSVCAWCRLEPAEVLKMKAKPDRRAAELKRLRAALKAARGSP